jgi:HAE1 family hydrophobic/amphiphilic exporter-1
MVKDIAIVEDGYKELVGDVRANYNQSVFLRIFKQSDANTVLACKNVHKAMPVIKEVLPEGTELEIVYDQSNYILRSVSNLGNTAIIAFILTFLVIYFFLRNMRSSIIMGLSIPISVISTFAIAGLALAIGMLVDNSIVVLENIYRLRETGFSAADSADTGASEVGMAITASTLTTIGVFLPVLFVPGIAGELFRDMVVTITFSLFASLVIALSLVPMLSSLIIKTESEFARKRLIKLKGSIANFLNKTVMKYSKLLHWSLGHKVKVIVYTFIVFVLTLVAAYLFIDMDFLPRHDQGFIALDVLRERGTPLNQTRLTVLELEKIVKEKVPEVTNVFATFGSTEGIAALFGGSGSHAINFRVRLTPVEERSRSQMEIESEMRKSLDNIPGISYQFRQQGGFSTERAVEVKIFGYNLTHSKIIAEQIKERMKRVPGLVDIDLNVKEGGDELRIIPDRKRLNDLKLNALQMANIVSIAMQGRTAALYREEGDEYNVVVRLDKPFRQSKEAIENLMIPIMPDKMIPLNQIARIEHSTAPTTIYRENQERYISVGCDLSDIALSEGVAEIKKIIQEISIPSEFQVVLGGTAEDQQESFFYLIIAFFAAVILVYMIMASQFESLVDPFIIMFTVPLAIIGVIIALLITGTVLSVMALVGLVMLAGIVVNNGIVMVDYINQLRRKGMELYEAVELGAKTRFRPVLMTAITTILGMVPLALELGSGSENWAPLARSVIGGLTTSTLLTLVIIPVVYILFEKLGERVKKILNW